MCECECVCGEERDSNDGFGVLRWGASMGEGASMGVGEAVEMDHLLEARLLGSELA